MRKRVVQWSTAQRAVVAVGWAGVVWALWVWVISDGWTYTFSENDGWFNYAPNSGVVFSGDVPSPLLTNPTLRLALQLVFVLVWALPSFWLFSVGSRPGEEVVDPAAAAEG